MAIPPRSLNAPTLLEVDLAILEYLIHAATSALLQNHTHAATNRSLEMFDGTYSLLKGCLD